MTTTLATIPVRRLIAKAKDADGLDWIIVNEEKGDFSFPVLYLISSGKKSKIAQDKKSPYLLVNRLKDKKLAQDLAVDLVNGWIKEQGKEKVQKIIESRKNFFEIEIQAMQKLGLKTPQEYKILVN